MVGLMGSGHCLAMCGGLAAALGLGVRGSQSQKLSLLLVAQFGRIASYGLIGSLFGGSLALMQGLFDIKLFLLTLRLLANLMLIAMGLYIAGWWFGLKRIESLALPLWRKLQPIQKRFLPMHSARDAFMVGVFWGWLPCGLVYSALVTSVSSGAHLFSGLAMASFGLGTLPSVWLMGTAGSWLRQGINHRIVRIVMALLLISYGINQLIQMMKMIF